MQKLAPTITIQDAYLQFNNEILFESLACTLPSKKITCLLGQSGVGKSSLLKLIAGILINDATTSANAIITTNDQTSLTNQIAYMAQDDLLLPWLNIFENVVLGFRLRKEINNTINARAKELLAKVGLTKAKHKYPNQLSGGMRQRAALARTLLENKPLVLMDEPFTALDTITKYNLQTLAAQLLQQKTVLLVTHDPLEALRLGDHILIMSGKPAKLIAPIDLTTTPPRDITDPLLLELQAKIMRELAANHEVMA